MKATKPQFELMDSSTEDLSMSKRLSKQSEDSSQSSGLFNAGLESDSKHSRDSSASRESRDNNDYGTVLRPVTFNTAKPSINVADFSDMAPAVPKPDVKAPLELRTPMQMALSSVFGRIDREQFEKYLKEPEYVRVYKKQPKIKQFRRLFLAQELKIDGGADLTSSSSNTLSSLAESNSRAIWATKFSRDGKFMATGGKDCTLRVWKVISSPLERNDLQASTVKGQATRITARKPVTNSSCRSSNDAESAVPQYMSLYAPVFHPLPYRTFQEHTQDILDLDWSKNGFLLTTSMDKTARLWHCDRPKALKTFTHPDFVTCAKFHPNDDRFFISGCLDHTCRLWSILDHKVSFEYYCGDIITAIDTSLTDGKYTAIGTFNGHISILYTKGLELISTFHILEKAKEHGKKIPESGPKITGIEFFKSEPENDLRVMITSNDSRVRIFSIKGRRLLEVLRGFENAHSQISAHLLTVPNKKKTLVIAPSENQWVYCWRLESSIPTPTSVDTAEGEEHHHRGSLRGLLRRSLSIGSSHSSDSKRGKNAGQNGNSPPSSKFKSDQAIKNSHYVAFHAHHHTVTTLAVGPVNTAKTLALSDDLICELTMALSETEDDITIMREQSVKPLVPSKKQRQKANELMERKFPSMIEAIGSIVVSTDSSGVIRVFRSDISTNVRKKVLKCSAKHFRSTNPDQDSEPQNHGGLLGSTMKVAHSTLAKSRQLGSSTSIRSLRSLSPGSERASDPTANSK
ncbi:LANO_0D07030g1_1 [Lachancea nothofagi CBS 11611]|uniref:LANO_0D07030g1_1 n=1 Tax=Lachancea nothofagi CBS 11611 TaxID=1266666 RepID=A0A1G4JI40_9SACH|nr:LANO_0D07030g1_1 [Lachancea nothofagi CBS 11611]